LSRLVSLEISIEWRNARARLEFRNHRGATTVILACGVDRFDEMPHGGHTRRVTFKVTNGEPERTSGSRTGDIDETQY